MFFDNIIFGNIDVKNNLISSVNNNNISHAYMFIGKDGIGKKIIAKEFAKMIMCEDTANDTNTKCKSCLMLKNNNHPDFFELKPDGNSIKIEQIRKMISKIYEKPIVSEKKVYIIDEANKMTQESSNCLLKILEEPPVNVIIILIVSNENEMLDTIKSRCNKVYFPKIDSKNLNDFLKKNYNYPQINNKIESIIDGSIGKAIEIKDKLDIYDEAIKLLTLLQSNNILELMKKTDFVKQNIDDILEYFYIDFQENLRKKLNEKKYVNCIDILEETKNNIKSNSNLDMCIDNLLLKLWKEFN